MIVIHFYMERPSFRDCGRFTAFALDGGYPSMLQLGKAPLVMVSVAPITSRIDSWERAFAGRAKIRGKVGHRTHSTRSDQQKVNARTPRPLRLHLPLESPHYLNTRDKDRACQSRELLFGLGQERSPFVTLNRLPAEGAARFNKTSGCGRCDRNRRPDPAAITLPP